MAKTHNVPPVGKMPTQNRLSTSEESTLSQAPSSGKEKEKHPPEEKKNKKVLLKPDENPGTIYQSDGIPKKRKPRSIDINF